MRSVSGSMGDQGATYVYEFQLAQQVLQVDVWQDDTGLITRVDANSDMAVNADILALDTEQCTHCPLRSSESPECPLAALVCPVVAGFSELESHTPARVTVTTAPRQYFSDTTVQQGLRSLLGLLMGGSACPHMAFFRPMARHHLPFSDERETLFRAVTNFALASQLLRDRRGQEAPELMVLQDIYQRLQPLNRGVGSRLRLMTESDATANAIVLLDLFAKYLGNYLEEGLDDVGELYADFLQTYPIVQGPFDSTER